MKKYISHIVLVAMCIVSVGVVSAQVTEDVYGCVFSGGQVQCERTPSEGGCTAVPGGGVFCHFPSAGQSCRVGETPGSAGCVGLSIGSGGSVDEQVSDTNSNISFGDGDDSVTVDNSDNSVTDSNNSTDNTDNSVIDSNNTTDSSDNSVTDSNNTTDNSVVNNYSYDNSVSNTYNIDGDYYESGDNNSNDDTDEDTDSDEDDDHDHNRVYFYGYDRPVNSYYNSYTPVYDNDVDYVSGAYYDRVYSDYLARNQVVYDEPVVTYTNPKPVVSTPVVYSSSKKVTAAPATSTTSSDETGYLGDYADLNTDAPLVEGPTQYYGFPTIEELYTNGVSDDRADKEKRVAKFFETYVDDVLEYDEYFLITFKNPFNDKIIFTFRFHKL